MMVSDPRLPALRGFGKLIRLECGHSQWEAGPEIELTLGMKRPCLSGCYRWVTAMGVACNAPNRW